MELMHHPSIKKSVNNPKLGVVAVKIYVKPIWKKLKKIQIRYWGVSIPSPSNSAILGGFQEVWAPILGVEGPTKW